MRVFPLLKCISSLAYDSSPPLSGRTFSVDVMFPSKCACWRLGGSLLPTYERGLSRTAISVLRDLDCERQRAAERSLTQSTVARLALGNFELAERRGRANGESQKRERGEGMKIFKGQGTADLGKPWRFEEDGLTVTRGCAWSPPGCHPTGAESKLMSMTPANW